MLPRSLVWIILCATAKFERTALSQRSQERTVRTTYSLYHDRFKGIRYDCLWQGYACQYRIQVLNNMTQQIQHDCCCLLV